jgi:hypothetical protein
MSGARHYSGPIRAVTKWETGVEIDLQSAIASQRSRPTHRSSNPDDSKGKLDKVYEEHDGSHVMVTPAMSLRGSGDESPSTGQWNARTPGNTAVGIETDMTEWTSGTGSEWTEETSRATSVEQRGTRSIP